MRFLAIFLGSVHRTDFKLHILTMLNDLDRWAVISPMLDHSKITKMPFWMIQNAKNVFLTIFRNLVCWIDFELHILIVLYDLDKRAVILPMLEHSKQVISQKLSMSDRTLQLVSS